MIANYLAAWDLIIERIRDLVPELADVLPAPDLARVREDQQRTPAAHVAYEGDAVDGSERGRAGGGTAQVVFQRWTVWIVVKNVRDQARGKAAYDEAGPLIAKVLAALSGWTPTSEFRPMRRVNGPRPTYTVGHLYFPLAFEAQLITVA